MKKLDLNIQLFAATLATQTLTELSYDVATNTSQVRYLVQIQTTGQSHNDNNITTTYYIDGIQYTNVHKLPYNSLTTIVDKTVTINHNLDGTREVTASFSCPTQISAGTITGTKATVLTTIPRASEITCSSGNIEDVLAVKITSNSNSFTHTITYTIGTYSGSLATKTSQTSFDFNTASIKDYIYSQIPNGTSISGTIRCTTYSGNTQIGDVKTSSFTLSASRERCCPTITNVTCIDTNTNLQQFTGSNQKFIRYKSLPKVDFTATARNSSSIASLYISMNGGQAFTSKPCTFTNMVSNIITITVTDTRGFSSQSQLTLDMIPYVELSISGDVKRDEELSFEGFFTGSIGVYNGSLGIVNNMLAISYDYKLSSASSFTTGGTISTYTLSGNKAILNHVSLGSNYNPDNEYIVRIYVTDKLGTKYGDIVFQKGSSIVEIGDEYVNINGNLYVNNKGLSAGYSLDLSNLDSNNFYPITFPQSVDILDCEIHSPSKNGYEQYNQNIIHFQLISDGYSDVKKQLNILGYTCYDNTEITIGCIGGGGSAGRLKCVWLRGGLIYKVYSNFEPTIHSNDFTQGNETYSVGTNYYGGDNRHVVILFTPQNTLSSGSYFSDGFTAGPSTIKGDFSVEGIQSITSNGNTVQIGAANSSFGCHFMANRNFYFNKDIHITGDYYGGSNYNRKLAYEDQLPTETVLYNNSNGDNGDITLSDSSAYYKYIEIYYMDNNGQDGGYVKLYNINGKKFDINLIEAGSSSTFIRRTGYTANGNVLTIRQSGYVQVGSSNHTETGTNYLYITRVVGLN